MVISCYATGVLEIIAEMGVSPPFITTTVTNMFHLTPVRLLYLVVCLFFAIVWNSG